MPNLPLTPDELLTTTRAVRTRLGFDRPVPDDLIRECVQIAMQSPSGSNNPSMQFVVVRDPAKKAAIGEIYRQVDAMYRTWDGAYIGSIDKGDAAMNEQQACVSPVAFTKGTDFKPASRPDADTIIHWDQW